MEYAIDQARRSSPATTRPYVGAALVDANENKV